MRRRLFGWFSTKKEEKPYFNMELEGGRGIQVCFSRSTPLQIQFGCPMIPRCGPQRPRGVLLGEMEFGICRVTEMGFGS